MMIDKQEILTIPTVVLAFLSLISCACVCASIYIKCGYSPFKSNKTEQLLYKKPEMQSCSPATQSFQTTESRTMMNVIIFWMCIVDGLHMIPIIANWTPQIFTVLYHDHWFWNKMECHIIGAVAQFCCIQSLLTYMFGDNHCAI